ncbi:MAG: ThuA domain-containing protein [Gemmatimonadales bacterium]
MKAGPATLALALILGAAGCGPPERVLLFSRTAGYRHSSIPAAATAIRKLGRQHGFIVDTTEDARYLTEDSLRNYSAVVFLHTTGELLERAQQVDLQRFIQAGGGFVGIHAAADAEYDWWWYGRLVGGYFVSHPAIQPATLVVDDPGDGMTKHLPDRWSRTDEWYNFKRLAGDLHVLLSIDETSYRGGTHGGTHPMTWYHEFDGGRAWYTALGHTEESWSEPDFLSLVAKGIRWAGGGPALDYGKARAPRVPADPGVVKTVLSTGTLLEPTELAILPNLDVLIAERRGGLLRYRASDGSIGPVGRLDVYWRSGIKDVNAEEGLLGLTLDPDFATNRYLYLFYSPANAPVNRLSRFTFGDSLVGSSEKIVLEFPSQRGICCHTGGSLAFGSDRILYLSTGDNATPFDEPGQRFPNRGFAPIDGRPGHEQYDARRTSANTNDLRGKILRIRVRPDGGYDIPEGNLFPPGTTGTRPEIYVMGVRNPYRISVDAATGTLYWGDVGPDAEFDSLTTRGPRGYDEINRTRRPGFFGWPLFVGENYAYRRYDFETGATGLPFDAEKPVNDSRNNTGLRGLPPAQPAFVWYPYRESADFPQVRTGGRTALAGPVYRADRYRGPGVLPRYFDGKLFIYDWIRGWIKVVTLGPEGAYEAMEPFLGDAKLAAPIDLEIGPDGALYVLEYGTGWFTRNPDAALSRIGRAPAAAGTVTPTSPGPP